MKKHQTYKLLQKEINDLTATRDREVYLGRNYLTIKLTYLELVLEKKNIKKNTEKHCGHEKQNKKATLWSNFPSTHSHFSPIIVQPENPILFPTVPAIHMPCSIPHPSIQIRNPYLINPPYPPHPPTPQPHKPVNRSTKSTLLRPLLRGLQKLRNLGDSLGLHCFLLLGFNSLLLPVHSPRDHSDCAL